MAFVFLIYFFNAVLLLICYSICSFFFFLFRFADFWRNLKRKLVMIMELETRLQVPATGELTMVLQSLRCGGLYRRDISTDTKLPRDIIIIHLMAVVRHQTGKLPDCFTMGVSMLNVHLPPISCSAYNH